MKKEKFSPIILTFGANEREKSVNLIKATADACLCFFLSLLCINKTIIRWVTSEFIYIRNEQTHISKSFAEPTNKKYLRRIFTETRASMSLIKFTYAHNLSFYLCVIECVTFVPFRAFILSRFFITHHWKRSSSQPARLCVRRRRSQFPFRMGGIT